MSPLRLYNPNECGKDGYPLAWHKCPDCNPGDSGCDTCLDGQSIKGLVRVLAGQRCVRCKHPYIVGAHYENGGEWSPCDERCTHGGPMRGWSEYGDPREERHAAASMLDLLRCGDLSRVEASWRILTVHHLTGEKCDCRWWNLVALCQRDHLYMQGRVVMDRPFILEHSAWFKPYAAGFYAHKYLDEDLTRQETEARLDELLAFENLAQGAS